MKKVTGVKFKPSGKTYYFDPQELVLKQGMHVIVDTAMGEEYGEVVISEKEVDESELKDSLKKVIRITTEKENKIYKEYKDKEKEAFTICLEKIREFDLPMKLVEAEYKFDGSKLTFYFSSEKRIDFRDLVKSLAAIFKTRIEMRQISSRDEVRLLGGNGVCGRELCCCAFLKNCESVTVKMIKEQNMQLNLNKNSGVCGRLRCCLRYEHDVYCDKLEYLPKVGSQVRTQDGIGEVASIEILKEQVRVKFNENGETFFKKYDVKEIVVLKAPKNKQENKDNLEELQELEELETKENIKNK